MANPNFERKPLICPKCGGSRMMIQEIYEMWETARPKKDMPNFGANFKRRVLCAEIGCQAEVWPSRWAEPEKGKKA